MSLTWTNRVALVTGAGGGLGRAYALLLASRGCRVVVNDMGVSTKGDGAGTAAADDVVDEIRAAGGEAVADYNSVEDGDKVVETAVSIFGRIDIIVNNAGILRDTTLAKMTERDWDQIQAVHLKGTYRVCKAAWEHMRQNKFGRIINVTSAAGLYGNVGQSNYAAAKMGIVGFTTTIAKEGASRNIKANVISPLADSRMMRTALPADMLEKLKPEYVAPLVAYLASEECRPSGGVFEIAAGWVTRVRWQRSKGAQFDVSGGPMTPEAVAGDYDVIENFDDEAEFPEGAEDSLVRAVQGVSKL